MAVAYLVTGINDPYEITEKPELDIDTSNMSALEASQEVFLSISEGIFFDE